ncbi:SagB/ThcOx family dehydrogenase [Microbacterium sp. BK668]|uniref:SagB/ThcOx family dehydrogenase n=1 Tax=Microbacterium sp. BK668 TaxID=2512118 RepID=UPI00105CE019|nr:SagB/ThcOx family dehydrogenase [Microbacterium sp. BK668]TDN91830.1 SagB-type dehydrogenase family enzyme [Microbacterium sp. BK668]
MLDFLFARDAPSAWTYHRSTARWLFNAAGGGESPPFVPGREDGSLPWVALPPPRPLELSLGAALAARVSCRRFRIDPLSTDALSTLLGAAYGVRAQDDAPLLDRPAPSGGGLYPLELTVLVRSVDQLASGVYHYVPARHGLELVRAVDLPPAFVSYLFMGQPWVPEAAVLGVISFVPDRSLPKYGDRGYRYALLEAGHVMQSLNLAAAALNLGCVDLGGFYDDELAALSGMDVEHEVPLYCCAIGIPDAEPRDRSAMRALDRGTTP